MLAKVRRLGFRKREACASFDSFVPGLPGTRRRPSCQPPQPPPIPLPPLRQAPATGTPAILADLKPGTCHWPLDDPGPGRMHLTRFCAGPAPGGVYCEAHRALAWSAR